VGREPNRLEKFFGGAFTNFVFRFRYFIIGIILIWSLVSAIYTTNLKPLSEQEQFIPDDHPLMVAADLSQNKFYSGESDISI